MVSTVQYSTVCETEIARVCRTRIILDSHARMCNYGTHGKTSREAVPLVGALYRIVEKYVSFSGTEREQTF